MLTYEYCDVATGHDEQGVLVFDPKHRLVAVLVRLSDENEVAPGHWYLEAGFGRATSSSSDPFASLMEAEAWILKRLDR